MSISPTFFLYTNHLFEPINQLILKTNHLFEPIIFLNQSDQPQSTHQPYRPLATCFSQVPYRLQGLRAVLQSEWDQEACGGACRGKEEDPTVFAPEIDPTNGKGSNITIWQIPAFSWVNQRSIAQNPSQNLGKIACPLE